jgi:hypothetical protein
VDGEVPLELEIVIDDLLEHVLLHAYNAATPGGREHWLYKAFSAIAAFPAF